mgnify:CR=1 FL=1
MVYQKTLEDFIQKARLVHGERYDYSKSVYKTANDKILITCKKHGDFSQTACAHTGGAGCNKCAIERQSARQKNKPVRQSITAEQFISRSKLKHGDKYDYSRVSFKGMHEKVCILCPRHGEFWCTPRNHASRGFDCRACAYETSIESRRATKARRFADDCKRKATYGECTYEKVNYIDRHTPVIVTCVKHGDFEILPSRHKDGVGCRVCAEAFRSLGERVISAWLLRNEIEFESQWTPAGGVYGRRLLYDFFANGVLIEFDGDQHFKPVKIFGGEAGFLKNQERDELKNRWAKESGVPLVRIRYKEFKKIDSILRGTFFKEESNELALAT